MDKPSFTVWIDPKTQVYKVDFNPQTLSPAEYGVVMASLILHISKMFHETNPNIPQEMCVAQMLNGVKAGLEQMQDVALPAKPH